MVYQLPAPLFFPKGHDWFSTSTLMIPMIPMNQWTLIFWMGTIQPPHYSSPGSRPTKMGKRNWWFRRGCELSQAFRTKEWVLLKDQSTACAPIFWGNLWVLLCKTSFQEVAAHCTQHIARRRNLHAKRETHGKPVKLSSQPFGRHTWQCRIFVVNHPNISKCWGNLLPQLAEVFMRLLI